jgi:hypothetical protein
MAEPTSPPAEPTGAEQTYRPVSGLAIAGLAVAVLFAVVMVLLAVISLVRGVPFDFPAWCLIFPLAGVVLSVWARWQIRNAEGTRAGMGLATSGLWISILFGLGIFTYKVAIYWAVRQQAEQALFAPDTGFFSWLKKPDGLHAAFLLTRPPNGRHNLSPKDAQGIERDFDKVDATGQPGLLSQFRNHFLVRMVRQGRQEAQIRPAGIKEFTYKEGGYSVSVVVALKTDVVEAQVLLTVRSQEDGEKREWYVEWSPATPHLVGSEPLRLTERGQALHVLHTSSHELAEGWAQHLAAGQVPRAFQRQSIGLDQIDRERREEFDRLLNPNSSPRPVVNFLCQCRKVRMGVAAGMPFLTESAINPKTDRLQVIHEFLMAFPGIIQQPGGAPPRPGIKLACIGRITVERTDAKSDTVNDPQKLRWRITQVEIVRADHPPALQRPGP